MLMDKVVDYKNKCVAYLNSDGVYVWGEVFPNYKVQCLGYSYLPNTDKFNGKEFVFWVDFKALTPEQKHQVMQILSDKSGVAQIDVHRNILKNGLPLREKYVFAYDTIKEDAP
jgi:hypothetical protein